MSLPDAATAPPRHDLGWLRHRARPRAQSPTQPAPVVVPAQSSLDLGSTSSGSSASEVADTSLDLTSALPEPVATDAPPRLLLTRRVGPARPEVLNVQDPVVTLTRLQGGIGTISVEAACSAAVGDLRLACAYRLSTGVTSLAVNRDGLALGPMRGHKPVLRVHRERFDTVTIDCRHVRSLDRLLVVGYSPSGAELSWSGTLLLTTFGGARVELPLDAPPSRGAMGLATIYQVAGELVVRAEPREVFPTVRDACVAFGFDRITWLDASTPAL